MPALDRGKNGRCLDCPAILGKDSTYRRCARCRSQNTKIAARIRSTRRSNNKCVDCGSGTDGGPRCHVHTPIRAAKTRKLIHRKRELIRKAKIGKPCVDCGRMWSYQLMEFDHVRGKKLFTISADGKGHSDKNILLEIGKCVVRCVVCHRVSSTGIKPPQGWVK